MIVTLGGKRWNWVWHRFGVSAADGECDHPSKSGKQIRVRDSLQRQDRQAYLMEVAIHEAMHAMLWPLSEEAVTEGAEDIARLLWKLGYRRVA